jgi:RNA polymerase sigma-70 factor, ECF subfamily
MDEGDAVARIKSGDIAGLEWLVRAYQTRAYEAAFLVVRDGDLAKDIVQAAFLRAYERIHQLQSAHSFGPWFLRIVVNSALSAANTRRNISLDEQTEEYAELADPEPGVEERFEAMESKEAILEALGKLSPGQRAAIVMRYYLEWSDAEVARKLEIPAGTVRRRLHDAKRKLRQLLPSRVL